jgi:peptidoglycan/xylan/chitin deacetylase (PgdA/CDA1 family)
VTSHGRPRVVNLCFHGIGTPQRALEPGEETYWVSVDAYHGILDAVMGDERVRINFDDGNLSDVEIGLPGLLARNLTARFFVLAGRLDQGGSLGAEDVRRLIDAGMTVGSHGMDHVPWRGLAPHALHRELVDARSRLEEVTRTPVDEAALPLGRYDRRVLAELRRTGYRTVYTSDRRWTRAGAWLQPRFSLHRTDTPDTVRRQMLTPAPFLTRAGGFAKGVAKRYR